jgi:hypothetical protein
MHTWNHRAFPAIERLKQIAGALTASIRMLPLSPQSLSVQAFGVREPLAAVPPKVLHRMCVHARWKQVYTV